MTAESLPSTRPLHPEIEIFDQAEVDKIKGKGNKLISPFWALGKLGVRYVPGSRALILAKLSQTNHGNELHFITTKRGLRMPASNIEALVCAEQEIYTSTVDFFPKNLKRTIDKLIGTPKIRNSRNS